MFHSGLGCVKKKKKKKEKKKKQVLYGKGFQKLVLSLKSLKPKNKILEFLKVQHRNCVVLTVSPYSSDLLKLTCM